LLAVFIALRSDTLQPFDGVDARAVDEVAQI